MIGETISHYKILEKLGEGGMGVVYKAEDKKLDRPVALKFLPGHLIDDEKALNRLLKEAKSASKINHPNVCTIYTIEDYEDTHFIVMEFVDGMTLRKRIKERANSHSPLRVDEAVDYSIQIGKALKAAHDKGIIHRDIKSENIMINLENMIKVMDFGLAKLKDEAGLTKTKTAGTIAYMSPEQLQGFEVDTRTDIWSFGVVLYEMLTGQLPFKGEYESAMMYSIVNTEPEPMKDVPGELEQTVCKALAKNSGERYQNVNELIEDLKKLPSKVTISEKQEKSIVVLPFVNMSPDPEQEYFSDGLTEEIITDLSHIYDLLVISRSSAMTFKGTKKKIKEIAKEVNVQYVLEGSVRKAGNNLRITAQLIDAKTDAHLWAEKYSGTLDDVFDIQEKVSRSIVDALKLKLTYKEDAQIVEQPIDNVRAYECYLKARHEIYRFTKESMASGIKTLQNGLDIFGENALLYATLGEAYYIYYDGGMITDEAILNKAEEYAKKTLALEPELAQGYKLLGLLERGRGSLIKTCKYMKKASNVDPDDSSILLFTAAFLGIYAGKPSIAEPMFKKLFKIDPLTPINYVFFGSFRYTQGNFDQALELLRKSYRMNPDFIWAKFWIANFLAANNQLNEAFEMIEQAVADERTDKIIKDLLLFLKYALKGERKKALGTLSNETKKYTWNDPDFSGLMPGYYALINENEQSLDYLEHAVNRGYINYPYFSRIDPFLKNIRGEERFKKLMERVKYEWENFEV